jgi:asparagine synthase (glutamine-hydrolysing)
MRGKLLLRDLLAQKLDRRLFERPKMGFAAPIGSWLRGDLRELATDLLLDDTASQRGYLDPPEVQGMVREHLSGAVDHGRALWTMLMLELWHREVVDGRARHANASPTAG